MKRVRLSLDMLSVDRRVREPMHRQIYAALRRSILDGRLKPNSLLPATRRLAEELGVGRNTVIAAYDALTAEGYLETRTGSGTWVVELPVAIATRSEDREDRSRGRLSHRGRRMVDQLRDRTRPGSPAFHPGYPEIETFPFSAWARLVKRHARYASEDIFGYHWVNGHPRLRTAIADYLQASRGVNCTAEQIVVVTGTQAALDIIARLLIDEGDPFWLEEPGYLGAYNALTTAGGRPIPLRVTARGWHFAASMPVPKVIFVTPSCHWPLGGVMRMDERLRLLQIAEEHNAWIIEDDYDSEYRFQGSPIPAMQGLDTSGRVIYIGTFAKTLFPALRIGFLVVPLELADGLKRAVSNTGQYPPLLLQAALADFMEEGFFSTHLSRMRRLYRKRQSQFVALCRQELDQWMSVRKQNAGMQLIARLNADQNDQRVRELALRHGVSLSALSQHYMGEEKEHGLLLGYAGVNSRAMEAGIQGLKRAFIESERGL